MGICLKMYVYLLTTGCQCEQLCLCTVCNTHYEGYCVHNSHLKEKENI